MTTGPAVEADINPSLARELAEILSEPRVRDGLACDGPLLVAARLLSGAARYEMTATTVVGVLGRDDMDAFDSLVNTIAQDFGLEATVKLKVGSFSVRFSRPPADGEPWLSCH